MKNKKFSPAFFLIGGQMAPVSRTLHVTGIFVIWRAFEKMSIDFTSLQKTFLGLLPLVNFGYDVLKKNVAEKFKTIPALDIKPYVKKSDGEFH